MQKRNTLWVYNSNNPPKTVHNVMRRFYFFGRFYSAFEKRKKDYLSFSVRFS